MQSITAFRGRAGNVFSGICLFFFFFNRGICGDEGQKESVVKYSIQGQETNSERLESFWSSSSCYWRHSEVNVINLLFPFCVDYFWWYKVVLNQIWIIFTSVLDHRVQILFFPLNSILFWIYFSAKDWKVHICTCHSSAYLPHCHFYKTCHITTILHVHELTFIYGGFKVEMEGIVVELQTRRLLSQWPQFETACQHL